MALVLGSKKICFLWKQWPCHVNIASAEELVYRCISAGLALDSSAIMEWGFLLPLHPMSVFHYLEGKFNETCCRPLKLCGTVRKGKYLENVVTSM